MKQLFESYTNALLPPTKIKLGLEVISKLDTLLGSPSKQFKSIHVGGTNGKGSVTTKMAHALHYGGYKVGLYTSPHLRSFRERIWVEGHYISEDKMSKLAKQVEECAQGAGIALTFFELLTLIAFLYFAEEKVEIGVVEVGMGGRLDATNIITPELSVITSIDFDHKEHLGGTLEQIAFEKAGIIKASVPVVLGASIGPEELFRSQAKEKGSVLYVAQEGVDFEECNQKTADLALSVLDWPLTKEVKRRGLGVRPLGRFQLIQKDPPILLDVAHNEAGLRALFEKISRQFPQKAIVAVAAFSSDEKAPLMAAYMNEKVDKLYLTQAVHERTAEPPVIKGAYYAERISVALNQAILHKEALLLITGTFFMMEEVFSFFEGREERGLSDGWASLPK